MGVKYALLSFARNEEGMVEASFINGEQKYGKILVAVSYTHLDVYKRQVYGMMNEKTLETIIEKTISEADAVASFTWQGGEPTLRGIDFFEKAAALQRKYKQQYQRNNLHIMNSFQTNGYELDLSLIHICRSHRQLPMAPRL